MPAKVTLTVTQGKLVGKAFAFAERTACIVGRADECHPRLPDDEDHRTVGRRHCLLDINPPDIRIRDFGSLNGTYVNGKKIGQRESYQMPEESAQQVFPEYNLQEGDEIKLGNTVFRVCIFIPVFCGDCSAEIPESQEGQALRTPGGYQCLTCRQKAAKAHHSRPPVKKARVCANCGRDVSREVGEKRYGDYVCGSCKADPVQIVKGILEQANAGHPELLAIQGYEILTELGRGGMGAVYLARQARTGKEVALKILLPETAASEYARESFLREAENTKALKHRHVVEMRDWGFSHGIFFFALEYCDGGSVDKLIEQRGGKLSIGEAGKIILQALDGLAYAHHAEIPFVKLADGTIGRGRGLVHRDISPHNIFLSGSGHSRFAKVGDYGLAKAFDLAGLGGHTRTGETAGKPWFMPRQQVQNFKYVQPEVDVWATAASLYSMLTGCCPRDFPAGSDVWKTVLETKPVAIRDRDTAIPKRLAEVIDLALVDELSLHFRTAVAFKQALEGVL